MKIAFLTPEFPHPKTGSSGGIGSSIANLANGLVRLGHEVSVLVYGQAKDGFFEQDGIAFYQIRNVKFKGLSWWLTRKKIERLANQLYRDKKVDLVEVPDWGGISSYIKFDCPVVLRLNGSDAYFCHLDKRPVKWINRHHEKRALQKADALLSVSRYTAQLTRELFGLKRDFTVIPNAVDTHRFEPALAVQNDEILYFGTLIRKKGLLELPGIFNIVAAKNPNARLTLVGKDSADIATGSPSTWKLMRPLFTPQALERVSYVGAVPYDDVKSRIAAATVCVFPTFAEALPVSWIEAMAMQKALVASSVGWAPEVVTDGVDGFLAHPTDHAHFANRIIELLGDASLRGKFGLSARETVMQKFDTDIVARQNIEFYKGLL